MLGRLFAGAVVLCDGAMGTKFCDRGISTGRCYDELNLSQQEIVAPVHAECLRGWCGDCRDKYILGRMLPGWGDMSS